MARFDHEVRNINIGKPSPMAGLVVLGIMVLVIGLWSSIKFVPAGHVGVLVVFGKVQSATLTEGIHLDNPLAINHAMSVRTVELTEKASVPSKEGLLVTLDTTLLLRLNAAKANEVYQSIGPRYVNIVVEPNLRSAIRSVTSSYSANALYTGERQVVAQKIMEELRAKLDPLGITVEDILLRDVKLPPTVTAAIEAKQKAEQDALRMQFVLQKEEQEAARKRIEARGIRDFNKLVAQGLSRQYLTWKGIEATEKLAGSPNAKVVVIGSGKDGLPIILGGQ